MKYYILVDKKIVEEEDFTIWGEFYSSKEKIVKQTYLKNGIWISTVFLGIDHKHFFDKDPRPILFETMIFGSENEYQERYCTYEDAEANHDKIVSRHINFAKLSFYMFIAFCTITSIILMAIILLMTK